MWLLSSIDRKVVFIIWEGYLLCSRKQLQREAWERRGKLNQPCNRWLTDITDTSCYVPGEFLFTKSNRDSGTINLGLSTFSSGYFRTAQVEKKISKSGVVFLSRIFPSLLRYPDVFSLTLQLLACMLSEENTQPFSTNFPLRNPFIRIAVLEP